MSCEHDLWKFEDVDSSNVKALLTDYFGYLGVADILSSYFDCNAPFTEWKIYCRRGGDDQYLTWRDTQIRMKGILGKKSTCRGLHDMKSTDLLDYSSVKKRKTIIEWKQERKEIRGGRRYSNKKKRHQSYLTVISRWNGYTAFSQARTRTHGCVCVGVQTVRHIKGEKKNMR